jgi:hypothetical protein
LLLHAMLEQSPQLCRSPCRNEVWWSADHGPHSFIRPCNLTGLFGIACYTQSRDCLLELRSSPFD